MRKDNVWMIDNFDVFARSTPKEINDEIREINKEDIARQQEVWDES